MLLTIFLLTLGALILVGIVAYFLSKGVNVSEVHPLEASERYIKPRASKPRTDWNP